MKRLSIALDGPSGAGKSTLARMVAEHFRLIYVDTGALYRCVALYVLRKNADIGDLPDMAGLLPEIDIELTYDAAGAQRMILNGEDVTDDIRSPEVTRAASVVSALPPVREFLLSMQRGMAEKYDVIMDGRDIGTVVLPNAGLKVFLTATPESRAKRRYLELVEKDIETTLDEVLSDMIERDKKDIERELAPLVAAEDSVLLDTTKLGLSESFSALCEIIASRFGI